MRKPRPNIFIFWFINLVICFSLFSSRAQTYDKQSHKLIQFLVYVSNYYVDSVEQNEIISSTILSVLEEVKPEVLHDSVYNALNRMGIKYKIGKDSSLSLGNIKGGLDEQAYTLIRFLSYISNFTNDTLTQQMIVENTIRKVLRNLDPHSTFITKDEVKSMNESLHGNFEGIGIQFSILHDTVLVVSPIKGGPSAKVGIKSGDRIVKIEDEIIAGVGIKISDIRKKLMGKKGTSVRLTVYRKETGETLEFKIFRGKIPLFSIDASYMVTNDIGYIKISKFSATMLKEFQHHMKKLKKNGMKQMILDLRENGGGYLNASIRLIDEFLDDGKNILHTEGLHSPKRLYKTDSKGNFEKGELVVLINESSASASEIFSGAVQDWDRGLIIGRRSYGKGLVQKPFILADGSMIRLTIARYYTPTGRLIQRPYDKGVVKYRQDFNKRFAKGELSYRDSIHFSDSLQFHTMLNNRIVYGGGGIMPDIFIPIDTLGYSDYYRNLAKQGIMTQYVTEYIDQNRKKIKKKYSTFRKFRKKFDVTDEMLDKLTKLAEMQDIAYKDSEFKLSKENIRRQTKALIARGIWNTSEYYEIMNETNKIFQKAVEVLDQKTSYLLLKSKD